MKRVLADKDLYRVNVCCVHLSGKKDIQTFTVNEYCPLQAEITALRKIDHSQFKDVYVIEPIIQLTWSIK